MSTISVYEPKELIAAHEEKGDAVYKMVPKKETKKYTGGAFYIDSRFSGMRGKDVCDGIFSIENVKIAGLQDPKLAPPEREENKPQISMKLSEAGEFGQMMEIIDTVWNKEVERLVKDKTIKLTGRRLRQIIQRTISENNDDPELAGKELDDPIIRIKMFDANQTFPEKYPKRALQGKKKTEILDYATRREVTDAKGNTQIVYDPATIEVDGKKVGLDFSNMWQFITPGSRIVKGRVFVEATAVTGGWVSLQVVVNKLVIEQGAAQDFEDDMMTSDAVPVQSTPTSGDPIQPAREVESSTADVEDALGDI